jgi:hypothetical protein
MKPLLRVVAAAALVVSAAACAPDAWRTVKATGFNEYLDIVQRQCQPLWFGSMNLPTFEVSSARPYESQFASLLDSASRLYCNRITPADFRTAVQGQSLSSDARTNRSIDCMIAQLSLDRPRSLPGGLLQ